MRFPEVIAAIGRFSHFSFRRLSRRRLLAGAAAALLVAGSVWAWRARAAPPMAPQEAGQSALAVALVSGDFTGAGRADVVSGWALSAGRGELRLQRGRAEESRGVGEKGSGGDAAPFGAEATVTAAPCAPDFLGAGDFNADGHADLVAGARGGNKLVWFAGDGRGGFALAGTSELPGALTALGVGEVNRPDGLPEVVAGIGLSNGAGGVLILEGPNGAGRATAEAFAMSAPAVGLALGALDGDALPDVAIAAGRELQLIAGRDRKLSLRAEEQATVRPAQISARSFPTALRDVALGDFTGDGRLDLAVLTAVGAVNILRQPAARKPVAWAAWQAEEAAQGEVWAGVQRLVTARLTGLPVSSLIGLSGDGATTRILKREATDGAPALAANGGLRLNATRWAETELAGLRAEPEASEIAERSGSSLIPPPSSLPLLPMRINGDALDDLVVLRPGETAPVIVPSAPAAIFIVNSSADTNDGVCNAANCTLREAINAANANPGLDEVRFNILGNGPPAPPPGEAALSSGIGESWAAAKTNGDVDAGEAPTVGEVDGSFAVNADGPVLAVAILPNEKILIAGAFVTVNGTPRSQIAQLFADGTLDPSFVPPTMNGLIDALAVQPNGKIFIGGEFTTIGGASRNRIARLNPDGTLDAFQEGQTGANDTVNALALQTDGKLLLAGLFTNVNGDIHSRVARFNLDGSLDNGFPASTSGANGTVNAIAVQSDGKIVIGGNFTSVSDNPRLRLARFNPDGTLDGFSPSVNGVVFALGVQTNDKILLGGSFTQFINSFPFTTRNRIARLNADGNLDDSFQNGQSGVNDIVRALLFQAGGKVLIGGEFTSVNGAARNRVARLNTDGQNDATFGEGQSGANDRVTALAAQIDGKALIGGSFTTVNGVARNRAARLLVSGNTIQFGSAGYSVNENGVAVTINVTRGSNTGAVAVNYATVAGGSALGGASCGGNADYVNTSGTLSWADGDVAPKSFTVTICEDNLVEGSETIALSLSNATGGATLGTPSASTVTILDNDSCSYQLNPTTQNFSAAAGNGVIAVTVLNGCSWQAVSNVPWITTNANGNGNGMAAFSVAANDTPLRSGTITIGGQVVTITQNNGCAYSLNPSVQPEAVAGGPRFLNVFSGVGCPWTAVSNAPWLTVAPGSAAGNGNGTVNYTVAANPPEQPARTGTMTVAGQIFTVLQSGAGSCSYTIAPVSANIPINGGGGAVSVTAPGGCLWTATSNNPSFLRITNGSGNGNGTFNYTVDPNDTGSPRAGNVAVTGGNTFTALQGTNNTNLRSITLNSPLPVISDAVTIDGWTQGGAGYAGPPLIEINGQNLAAQGGGDGLTVTGGNSLLRGLVVNRFASVNRRDSAIILITNGNNVIVGCYVGPDANGIAAFAPANTSGLAAGISLRGSAGNLIGGTTAANRNLISGLDGRGLVISDSANNNQVQGNYIGTDVTGSVGLGFQRSGINVQNAMGNTIGGTAAGAGNLISGNLDYGVFLQDDARMNTVQGNFIGTNSAGVVPVANSNAGVFLFRPSGPALTTMNTIGGTTPAARNVISGNGTYGVVVGVGATATLVQGNYLGTSANGAAAVPNTYGMSVTQATGSTIGGDPTDAPTARNVISGNRLTGVFMGALNNGQAGITGASVQNNYIGTDAAGEAALGNGGDGVFVEVQSVTDSIDDNRIAFNGGSGVRIPNVTDVPGTPAFQIDVDDNDVYANGGDTGLGLDLGDSGINPDDEGDGDGGANQQQNFPIPLSANFQQRSGAKDAPEVATVMARLNSRANIMFTIDWQLVDNCNANNQPTGARLGFGALSVLTDSNGPGVGGGSVNFSFSVGFPPGRTTGKVYMVAKDPDNNTSEFSPCIAVTDGGAGGNAVVQFSNAANTVNEGAGGATVTVNRAGNTASAVTVDYATTDGTALQRTDYTVTSGTLSFAAGETSKTFTVPVADDLYTESAETLTLTLANLSAGVTLGANANATLTITDNDTMQPDAPPANEFSRVFVARLNGGNEIPANSSTATGGGTVALNAAENQITVNMSFSGLSSAQTAAHIHAAAHVTANAPILFTLSNGTVTNQTLAVTAQQVQQLRAGLMYFNVHTTNFSGGEIRGQIVASPVESARYFVRQQYADFLSRLPDQAGEDFWTGQIATVAGTDLALIKQRRVAVSNAFFFEQEYQQTGAYTYRLYRAAFGNTQPFPNTMGDLDSHPYCTANPNNCQLIRASHVPSYAKFATDRARLDATQLATTQLALATAFAQRSEFTARYPLSQTAEQFVDALLATIQTASNANLTGQRANLIALFNSGGRGAVLFRLAEDNQAGNPVNNRAFIDAEYNRAFVTTQYFGYLRRDADLPGLNFWLSVVNQFPLRSAVGQNGMVCAFITSREYQERFGPGVTRSNQTDCQ